MARFIATFKASGVPSSQRGQQNGVFFWMPDATLDADVIAAAESIATLMNGMLTSVSKSLFTDPLAQSGPWPSASANGGSDRARLLFRNANGETFQMSLPFLRQDKSKVDMEAVFEGAAFQNDKGGALGQLVSSRAGQIVD